MNVSKYRPLTETREGAYPRHGMSKREMGRLPNEQPGRRAGTDTGLAAPALSFGPFCVVPAQRLLLEEGRPVPVGSRALDILIALTERPGMA